MSIGEVTLGEILAARESRVARQKALLSAYRCSLICLTLNIPGPQKVTPKTERVFRIAVDMVLTRLGAMGLPEVQCQLVNALTGSEGYFMVELPARMLKAAMVELEDYRPLSRLFDLDVLDADGTKLSRSDLGFPSRKCLLCDRPAPVCARSRAHSLDALQARVQELIDDTLEEDNGNRMASLAVKALLYEACAAPKPGLVDRIDQGSHADMDIFSFLSSASTLQPYFSTCFRRGRDTRTVPPQETFRQLRLPGMLAETEMYRATGGVNTHKGAIFSLGVVCGALGRMEDADRRNPENICAMCAAMTEGLTRQELSARGDTVHATNGEQAYRTHSIGGVRAMAEQGYPAVLHSGLPTLRSGLSRGLTLEQAGCAALVALMADCDDTNLIARGGIEALQQVKQQADALLAQKELPDFQILSQWNQEMTARQLSPGGSADLLALTYFLHFLERND